MLLRNFCVKDATFSLMDYTIASLLSSCQTSGTVFFKFLFLYNRACFEFKLNFFCKKMSKILSYIVASKNIRSLDLCTNKLLPSFTFQEVHLLITIKNVNY